MTRLIHESDQLCRATVKFLQWQPLYEVEKPFQIFINIPDHVEDKRTTNLVFEDVVIDVQNVRTSTEKFSLDENGFRYIHHKTNVEDFTSRESIEREYLPEIEALLRKTLDGVDKVFFFDWRLRINAPEVEGTVIDLNDPTTWLRPALHVHVDQSPAAVLKRIQLQLTDEASNLLQGRVRVINIWKPLVDKVQDWPLAVCDGRTINRSDLVEADHVRRHYTGSTMYLKHNAKQRFFYMKDQTRNELLLFKNFDSDRTKASQFAPHAAFRDPHNSRVSEPRKSIELRALVFTYDRNLDPECSTDL